MESPPQSLSWSAGDEAILTDGDYAGMYVRIWEVNLTENTAIVSLRVFGENQPFKIDLSCLRKPTPATALFKIFGLAFTRQFIKAIGLGLLTTVSGPLLLLVFLLMLDMFQMAV